MSKNLIPEITKLLGVEIGEEFKVRIIESGYEIKQTFRFTEKYLEYYDNDVEDWKWAGFLMLLDFIRGKIEIVKLPYKPKVSERYFTYFGAGFTVVDCAWQGFATQYSLLKNGCIFRTKEEALEARPRIYKELTGKDWSE